MINGIIKVTTRYKCYLIFFFFFSTLHTCLKVVFHFDNFLFITCLGTKTVWKKELGRKSDSNFIYPSSYTETDL